MRPNDFELLQKDLDKVRAIVKAAANGDVIEDATKKEIPELVAMRSELKKLTEEAVSLQKPTAEESQQIEELRAGIAEAKSTIKRVRNKDNPRGDIPDPICLPNESTYQLFQQIERRRAGHIDWMQTGFESLDDMLDGGLMRGQLVIIAARPAVGKSTIAMQIAESLAKDGTPVLYLGLEVGGPEFMRRAISRESGISMKKLKTGQLADDEMTLLTNTIKSFDERPLITAHAGINTPEDMEPAVEWFSKWVVEQEFDKPGLIVVDYLQLMSASGNNRSEAVGNITRYLKQTALKRQVPVLALAQMNRDSEKRQDQTPVMSDLRESGAIEQDADIIIFLDRPQDKDQPQKLVQAGYKRIDFILAKQRDGKSGTIRMAWEIERASFKEPDEEIRAMLETDIEAVASGPAGGKGGKINIGGKNNARTED